MAEADSSMPMSAHRDTATVAMELLGGFRVRVGSRLVCDADWRLQKAASLTKLLALAPGHRLSRDRAMDLLWPDLDPEGAKNNLYQALHCIRRALRLPAGQAVALQHGVISLLPGVDLWIDVDGFEAALAVARRSNDLQLYYAALELYSGDLLPDDLYEDWAASKREGLKRHTWRCCWTSPAGTRRAAS